MVKVSTSWIGIEIALGPDRFLLSAFAFDIVPGRGHMGAGVRDTLPAGERIPALRTILLALGLQMAGFRVEDLARLDLSFSSFRTQR